LPILEPEEDVDFTWTKADLATLNDFAQSAITHIDNASPTPATPPP